MSPISIPYSHRYENNRRGRGLGGILRSVGNVIKPFFNQTKTLLKPIGKELSKEGVALLSHTAKDAINGTPLSQALKKNFVKRKRKVIKRVKKKIGVGRKSTKGRGAKKGRGRAKKGRGKAKKGRGKAKRGKGKSTAKGKGKKKVGRPKRRKVGSKKKTSIFDGYSF